MRVYLWIQIAFSSIAILAGLHTLATEKWPRVVNWSVGEYSCKVLLVFFFLTWEVLLILGVLR